MCPISVGLDLFFVVCNVLQNYCQNPRIDLPVKKKKRKFTNEFLWMGMDNKYIKNGFGSGFLWVYCNSFVLHNKKPRHVNSLGDNIFLVLVDPIEERGENLQRGQAEVLHKEGTSLPLVLRSPQEIAASCSEIARMSRYSQIDICVHPLHIPWQHHCTPPVRPRRNCEQ